MNNKNSIKVTVIIPAYNEETGIKVTLNKIIKIISYDSYEIIVVDDNSKDKTAKIVSSFESVNLLQHTANKGYGAALKTGINNANNEIICIIDADGTYLGKYRKNHIPHVAGFYEKFFFKPGNLGYPVFETAYCNLGVYICYDRHFPEGWRALALNGAEYIVNPSATVAGLSQYLWVLEQPASAVANGCFIGAINRVGSEEPWNIGKFYGSSYVVNPRGKIEAQLGEDEDGLLVHDMDMDMVREIRNLWQFFRDRRPEVYEDLIELR